MNILTLYGYLIIYGYLYFFELVMIKLNESFIRLLSSLAEKKREIYVKWLLDCFLEQPSELWIEKITNNEEYQRFCISYAKDIDIIQDNIELNKRELLLKVQNRFDTIVDNLATKSYASWYMEYVSLIVNHNNISSARFEDITLQEIEQRLKRVLLDQDSAITDKILHIKKRFNIFTDELDFTFDFSIGIRCDASLVFIITPNNYNNASDTWFFLNVSNNEQKILEFIMNYTNSESIISGNIDDIVILPDRKSDDGDSDLLV